MGFLPPVEEMQVGRLRFTDGSGLLLSGPDATIAAVAAHHPVAPRGSVYFSTGGNYFVRDAYTGSGVGADWSGQLLTHVIRYAHLFDGADAGVKIAAAITDLPSTGGIVDARGFEGVQACSVDPFAGLNKTVQLLLGAATYRLDVTWELPGGTVIRGAGRGATGTGTELMASATFANTYTNSDAATRGALVVLGRKTAPAAFGVRLEDLKIDGQNPSLVPTANIGVYSENLQEQSGLHNVLITRAVTHGVWIEQTAAGRPFRFTLNNVESFVAASGSAVAAILLDAPEYLAASLTNITVNEAAGTSTIPVGIQVDAYGVLIQGAQLERVTDGILIGSGRAVQGVFVNGVRGMSATTNLVHVANTAGVNSVTLNNLWRVNSTKTILDDLNSYNSTSNFVESYSILSSGVRWANKTAGVVADFHLRNSDNTNAGSHTRLFLSAASGATGGDAFIRFDVDNVWSLGNDRTDDAFKLSDSGLLGATDRLIVAVPKVLVDNADTPIASITIANNTVVSGVLTYGVEVTDGTDVQVEEGRLSYHATNKAGIIANNATAKSGNQQAATVGTLVVTWTITAANPTVLTVNVNSSLIPSAGYPLLTFSIENLTSQAVVLQ